MTAPSGCAGWLVVVGLVFGASLACSQPTVFANARHVALAPTAVRNRRRVNLEPIAGTLHYSRALVDNLVSLIQAVQKCWLGLRELPIAERSRREKLRKAREGKVMAGHRVKYSFKLNTSRDGLLVDEEKMRVVRRIFRMVGVEGHSMNAVYKAFERERRPARYRSRRRTGDHQLRACLIVHAATLAGGSRLTIPLRAVGSSTKKLSDSIGNFTRTLPFE